MVKTKISINGALGRMGRRLLHICACDEEVRLVGAITHKDDKNVGKSLLDLEPQLFSEYPTGNQDLRIVSSLNELRIKPDVVIDFSTPEGAIKIGRECTELGVCLIIGSTGLSEAEKTILQEYSIPKIHAMNFSVGVALLSQLSEKTANALGTEFDIEVVEVHHNRKVDAPSGTAISLVESICQGRSDLEPSNVLCGRGANGSGRTITGKRTKKEIGVHSLRCGNVTGEHKVIYTNDFETITLEHKAHHRDVFAAGAVRAAKWIVLNRPDKNKPMSNTMYTINDVLST